MLQESLSVIRKKFTKLAPLGVVFGSGLGEHSMSSMKIEATLSYDEIPHWNKGRVQGHSGELVQAIFGDKRVWILKGRSHLYEGLEGWQVTYPIRTLAECGLNQLILTNACGSLSSTINRGDLALIVDQVNLTGTFRVFHQDDPKIRNPFLDASQLYDPDWSKTVISKAHEKNFELKKGVYVGLQGPCYETPAEVKVFREWGGDFVGMSTVCEALMAGYLGLKTLGISCVANEAPKLGGKMNLTHEKVLNEMEKIDTRLARLLLEVVF